MFWQVDFWLLVIMVICALIAISVRDLLATIVVLGVYSFFAAVLFAQLGAIDVAFMEALLGAGITGVLLISALFFLKRRPKD